MGCPTQLSGMTCWPPAPDTGMWLPPLVLPEPLSEAPHPSRCPGPVQPASYIVQVSVLLSHMRKALLDYANARLYPGPSLSVLYLSCYPLPPLDIFTFINFSTYCPLPLPTPEQKLLKAAIFHCILVLRKAEGCLVEMT